MQNTPPKLKVDPKPESKEWFKFNYSASNFNWQDALDNGLSFYTTSVNYSLQEYRDHITGYEIIK